MYNLIGAGLIVIGAGIGSGSNWWKSNGRYCASTRSDRKNSNSNDYYRCIIRRFSIWSIILRKIIQTKTKNSVL